MIDHSISVLVDSDLGSPARYGVGQLLDSLKERKVIVKTSSSLEKCDHGNIIAVGFTGWALIKELAGSTTLALPKEPESLLVKRVNWNKKTVIFVLGSDDRGVLYATLDVARAIRLLPPTGDVLQAIAENCERPDVSARGICMFLHSEDLEKEWYYSEDFWKSYFHMLAECRFNSFNLIFAHQTYYLAPPYPFLFDVEEYPEVKVTRLSKKQREKNLKMLQFISNLAENRGIEFVMGIWQHRAWPFLEYYCQPSLVEGLSDENISEYSRLALTKLLKLCPSIKAIQLRMNQESGIARSKRLAFYRDAVFRAMKECGRPVRLDFRIFGEMTDVLEAAKDSGLKLRISMKHWGEMMGPPYHPADFRVPLYSFQNYLKHPREYEVWYQVWSLGSHRVLLWGDPAHVKRFASSCHLGMSSGFEICAPLSQKGFGNEPGNWRIFESPDLEYYKWEYERYWLFYLLFGRLTYNPETSENVWMREIIKRFGSAAAPHVMNAYEWGSKVISSIVAYNLSNYNMYIWPEKGIGGLIDYYIETEPSDRARIYAFKEYVSACLDDTPNAKATPTQVSNNFKKMANSCLEAIDKAKKIVDAKQNREFSATMLDMEILSGLAQYHSEKVLAGEQLSFFYATGDLWTLRRAKEHAKKAMDNWFQIVDLTDGVYYHRMIFGPGDTGHWKDNIIFVRYEVERLEELERLFERYGNFDIGFDFGKKPEEIVPGGASFSAMYQPIISNYPVERGFKGAYNDSLYDSNVGYGWIDVQEIYPSRVGPSLNIGPRAEAWEALGLYSATRLTFRLYGNAIYDDYVCGTKPATFRVDLPNGEYDITLIMKEEGAFSASPSNHGPMTIRIQGEKEVNSLSVPAGEIIEYRCRAKVSDGKLLIDFFCAPGSDWIINGLTITNTRPRIAHIPKRKAVLGEKIRIDATVTSTDPVTTILHYRNKGTDTYSSLQMKQVDKYCYKAEIPQKTFTKGDLEYYIEATKKNGKTSTYPQDGKTKPIIIIGSQSDDFPRIYHDGILKCTAGKPLAIIAKVESSVDLRFVRLHYRDLNAFEKYKTVPMKFSDGVYQAAIPASDITEEWDLMYYIEAVNMIGNGTFFPDAPKEEPYVIVKTH
jgi:hypothetical protein